MTGPAAQECGFCTAPLGPGHSCPGLAAALAEAERAPEITIRVPPPEKDHPMGYYSRLDGEITITPPLTWPEFKDTGFHGTGNGAAVRLRVVDTRQDTPDGFQVHRVADAIIPSTEDSQKAYHWVDEVREIVAAFPGHTFAGHITREGDEQGDVERVTVAPDGTVTASTPLILWPGEPGYDAACQAMGGRP